MQDELEWRDASTASENSEEEEPAPRSYIPHPNALGEYIPKESLKQATQTEKSPKRILKNTTTVLKQPHPSMQNSKPKNVKLGSQNVKQESSDKVLNFGNPKKFVNVLERQAERLAREAEGEEQDDHQHELSQPQLHTTKILQSKVKQLQQSKFEIPEPKVPKSQQASHMDFKKQVQEIVNYKEKDRIFNSLVPVESDEEKEQSAVKPIKKRAVAKQVSESYLKTLQLKPSIEEYFFASDYEAEMDPTMDSFEFLDIAQEIQNATLSSQHDSFIRQFLQSHKY